MKYAIDTRVTRLTKLETLHYSLIINYLQKDQGCFYKIKDRPEYYYLSFKRLNSYIYNITYEDILPEEYETIKNLGTRNIGVFVHSDSEFGNETNYGKVKYGRAFTIEVNESGDYSIIEGV